jgi:hypothetical protein
MKRIGSFLSFLMLAVCGLQAQGDPRSIHLMGIALEGPIDSLREELKEAEFTEWGGSDDGEDYYYRGKFYGIRAKLMISTSATTHLATSAYITIGPYSTETMLQRNMQYFLNKLQKEHGDFVQRDELSFYHINDYGSVKISVVHNDNGSRDIRVLYISTGAYYKDALCAGLHGSVQEVVTENAVAEEQFQRFLSNGQIEDPDLTHRQYDRYGYLKRAQMKEKDGVSDIVYDYDSQYRLVRRTLTNQTAGIKYVHEFTYNSEGEIQSQNQKVFEKDDECTITINMHNNYLTRDEEGNWTTNSLILSYWEKDSQSQQTTVLQKRTLAYWK